MTKWANPTSRRRVHPAWYLILFLACIVALLAVTCQGCSLGIHYHNHSGPSELPPITISIPAEDGDA